MPILSELTVTVPGLILIEKSETLKRRLVVRERLPLVPVTATVKLPTTLPVHPRLAVEGDGGTTTLAGATEHVGPEGDVETANVTVPLKPLIPATETVALALTFTGGFSVAGLNDREKS